MPYLKRVLRQVDQQFGRELLGLATGRNELFEPLTTETEFMHAVSQLGRNEQQACRTIARRINTFTDEAGQELLSRLVINRQAYEAEESPFNQAAWVLLRESDTFEQAESERFADIARYTRQWDSYRIIDAVLQPLDIDHLKKHLTRFFFGGKDAVLVDSFPRHRIGCDGAIETLEQVMVYREGVPTLLKEVSKKTTDLHETLVRPAREYAFLWHPAKAELEVIARKQQERCQLARIFSSDGLGVLATPEKLKKRTLTLDNLKDKPLLPFTRDEGIAEVSVTFLKLRSANSGEFSIRSPARRSGVSDVYGVVEINHQEALLEDPELHVVEAMISVKYRQQLREKQARQVRLSLKTPCASNIQEMTDRERHLSWCKLKEWGLTDD